MAHAQALVTQLKRALRKAGVTYRDVAAHLGLSEASVKRLFREQSFSIQRMEQTLALIKLDFRDLVEQVSENQDYLTELTPEQEDALVADRLLLLVTFLVVNRWRYEDILSAYDIEERALSNRLMQLNNLSMIELLPFDRYRLLTARTFTWRRNGPVQKALASLLSDEFFDHGFAGDSDKLRFLTANLSVSSIGVMHEKLDQLVMQFDELATRDSRLDRRERKTVSAVLALRPVEYSIFAEYRR